MINISRIYATTIIQKIALYCSSYSGNDLYYLKEAIMLLINIYGEDKLIEMMKEDKSNNSKIIKKIAEEWYKPNGMKNKLKKISTILEKINKSYSILEDKSIPKKDKEKIKYKDFIKQCKEFPKIENDFYALFVFLIENSSIKHMNISQQYLKVLEQGKSYGAYDTERIGE